MLDDLPDTDRECIVCEDGRYLRDGHELICSVCQHTPSHDVSPNGGTHGSWESFRRLREQYSGFYGPERVKMVGGFLGAYDFDEDF